MNHPARSFLRLISIAIIGIIVYIQLVDITVSGSSNAENALCSDNDANDRSGSGASCIVATDEYDDDGRHHHRHNKNKEWKWDPTSNTTHHPCTIHRISRPELHRLYGPGGLPNLEYPFPIIIHPDDGSNNTNAKFANQTSYTNLPTNFPPNFQVTLSGSDSLSTHRRTIPLQQYLTEIMTANNGSGTTLPTQLGNETWYFFGETHSSIWSKFLREYYALPPCQSCTTTLQTVHQQREKIALSFGIGNIGSGVQWHTHGPGFSETVHGAKHWVLYPPENEPLYDLNYASRHWMENTYSSLDDWTTEEIHNERRQHEEFWQRWKNIRQQQLEGEEEEEEEEWRYYFSSAQLAKDIDAVALGPSKRKPWECTVHEGEIIYFPNLWHHATINLEKYTVFVSSFT